MPDEIVWVDKVLNPRSAVLTHNEALNVLKNAKDWTCRPHLKATFNKSRGTEKKLTLAQQKDEYINLQQMFIQQDEMKPILEMQAELDAIEKSKDVFKNAIEERLIFPDGLPRLKPSVSLKKEIVRSKRIKGNETAEKLALIDKSAINKKALRNILDDDIDDDAKEDTPMEVDTPSDESKPELDNGKPAAKKRRVIIDEDTDDEEDETKDSKTSIQLLSQDPSKTALEFANDRLEFKHSFSTCADVIKTSPVSICFEATKEETKVLAMAEEAVEVLEDNSIPTNLAFTDYAIQGVLKPPTKEIKNSEEAFGTFLLGESSEKLGSTALTNSIKPPANLGKSTKTNYTELIKDKDFCSKLIKSCEADWDVSSYFELDSDYYRAKDNEYLPKLQILNSLFCAYDLDLLQYQADIAVINASRVRERQRVQHPFVKVRPTTKDPPHHLSQGTVMATKSSSLTNVMKRLSNGKSAAIKQEGEAKTCIAHNTVIHEALKYLEKSQTAHRYKNEIRDAYKKLSKYPLTFLEKMNLIHTSPKDLPGMLCVLDDLGLRFSKDVMDEFEKDCASLWAPKRHRIKRNSSTTL
uniref:Uncharacterized protein n=1 Tax=Panagrolaimus davidi TaxID=227884 RepID=A0A914PIQ2_9BILA